MCLYLLYPTFTPTIVYLILPLEACGGQTRYRPPKGNIVIGHLEAISLDVLAALAALASLVSNVLISALPNFHPFYCLLDFASGGLWGPNRVTGHLKATSLQVA